MPGSTLLSVGIVVCVLGLVFGLVIYRQLKNMPVHKSMLEISELIYETCKTYLITQGKFILLLEVFIGVIMVFYFGVAAALRRRSRSSSSCCSAWSASPAATASPGSASASTPSPTRAPPSPACKGKPYPIYAIPLKAGMSIGMLLISVELVMMLVHPALRAARLRRRLLHRLRHRRVAGRLGAAHRRRHLHQDRRHRLRPDEDRLQHQGRRRAQPRRHRRLHRRQRRRLGRPHAPTASRPTASPASRSSPSSCWRSPTPTVQVQLLVWIFAMRIMMIIASGVSYFVNEAIVEGALRQRRQDELRGAADPAGLADLARLGRA